MRERWEFFAAILLSPFISYQTFGLWTSLNLVKSMKCHCRLLIQTDHNFPLKIHLIKKIRNQFWLHCHQGRKKECTAIGSSLWYLQCCKKHLWVVLQAYMPLGLLAHSGVRVIAIHQCKKCSTCMQASQNAGGKFTELYMLVFWECRRSFAAGYM